MNIYTIDFIRQGKLNHSDDIGDPLFIYPDDLFIKTPSQPEKVKIICIIHGDCMVVPRHHLSNNTGGCSKCRIEKCSLSKMAKSKEQWNKDIQITHIFNDGMPKYDYSKFVFVKRTTPGIIICLTCKKEGRVI
jgi:hypothetical protein